MEAIYNRRSIRKYKQQTVPADVVRAILDAGRMAPSGKNRQPWKFIVFAGRDKEELLNAMERGIAREKEDHAYLPASAGGLADAQNTLRIMREAPIAVIILNTNGRNPFESVTPDERVAEIVDSLSIGAAVENMLLQAEELGIGCLWIANTWNILIQRTSWLARCPWDMRMSPRRPGRESRWNKSWSGGWVKKNENCSFIGYPRK